MYHNAYGDSGAGLSFDVYFYYTLVLLLKPRIFVPSGVELDWPCGN